jgi:cyanate permease
MQSSYRIVIEILIGSVMLFVGLLWIAPGPLFPMIMHDYAIDRATVSFSTSLVSLVMGIFAIPAGVIAHRIGLRKTFAIGAFLMAAGALTFFSTNIVQLIATRIVLAIGVAMAFPIAGGLIVQWFSGREIPLINGINMSMVSIGNSLALFISVLLANVFGWKATLGSYGALVFVFALAWLVLGRERKEQSSGFEDPVPDPSVSIISILKRRETLLLGLSVSGPFILFMAISSWLPTYYNEVFGMPLSQASSITGLFPLFGIGACIVGGFLPMQTGLRKPFLVIPGLLLGFTAMGTFLFNNLTIIYISIALFGISLFIGGLLLPETGPKAKGKTAS